MQLFGDKTVAFLDIWSIEHFIAGISMGSVSIYILKIILAEKYYENEDSYENSIRYCLPIILTLAYLWECIEFYLEAGFTHIPQITYWFQGVEFWGNRLIADPALVVGGAILGLKRKYLINWARGFTVFWLYINILVMPNSMHLQRVLFD